MTLLILYWAIMLVCYAVASKLRDRKEKFSFVGMLTNAVICVLVFLMGLRMGANEEVTSNLGTIGLQSLFITVFVVGGSVIAVHITRKLLKLNKEGMPESDTYEITEGEEKEAQTGGAKFTLIILAFVVGGMLLGYFFIPEIFENTDEFQAMSGNWLVVGICILLGLAGFDLGM